eukprot:sb/3478072/
MPPSASYSFFLLFLTLARFQAKHLQPLTRSLPHQAPNPIYPSPIRHLQPFLMMKSSVFGFDIKIYDGQNQDVLLAHMSKDGFSCHMVLTATVSLSSLELMWHS